MIQVEKLGVYLAKPISVLLVLIYLVQSGLMIYLIRDKFDLQRQINFQQNRIDELEERLRVLKAVEDFQTGFKDEEILKLADVIYTESRHYRYDPMFVMAIILTESSFRRGQQSSMGALGLMQVKPSVGQDVAGRAGIDWQGSQTLFESEANIKVGTRLLFEQILKFGNVEQAILAYNLGAARLRGLIQQGHEVPRSFLKKVIDNYKMLRETYSA